MISFYPAEIHELKPGLIPSEYFLPASDGIEPSILLVGNSRYIHKNIHETIPPTFTIPVFALEIAQSVVDDLVKAKLACVPGEKQPAIFALDGEWTKETVLKLKKTECEKYLKMQALWFQELIKMADIDWAKQPGSHQLVTEDAKRAAKALGYERDWVLELPKQIVGPKSKECKGCASDIPVSAIICKHCQTVQDEKAYAGLKVADKGKVGASV